MIGPAIFLLPLALLLAVGPAVAQSTCPAPAELVQPDEPQPAVVRALAAGVLRVLVVGSASVRGPGSSGPEAAWPARLEAVLGARRAGLQVRMTVLGGQSTTAVQQVELLAEALRREPFDVLVWQTGTVEAVRGLDVGDMMAALNVGLDLTSGRGMDAVLMDSQFSRFLRANADLGPYQAAMRLVATARGVTLFRRHELMRHWVDAELIDVERAGRANRVPVTDRLNTCLAEALATLLLAARP